MKRLLLPAAALALLPLTALEVPPAGAAPTVVDETADELNADGDCSLREAVQSVETGVAVDACTLGGDPVVTLPAGVVALDSHLDVASDLTLAGAGTDATTVACGPAIVTACIRNVGPTSSLVVADLTLADAPLVGIQTFGTGSLVLDRATVRDTGTFGISSPSASPVVVRHSALVDTGSSAITSGDATVTLADSTIRGGQGSGLAIHAALVTVERSEISGKEHGIAALEGQVAVRDSTIRSNEGFGIQVDAADVDVASSTIARNGIHGLTSDSGDLVISSSTIAQNAIRAFNFTPGAGSATVTSSILANGAEECDNEVTSLGHNLTDDALIGCDLDHPTDQVDVDPRLGVLGDNGGPTSTYLPLADSPALDRGDGCPIADQRGQARPTDADGDGVATCDVGAVEVAGVPGPSGGGSTPTSTPATPTPSSDRPVAVATTPTFTG